MVLPIDHESTTGGGNTESEMTIGELAQMMESGESYTDSAKRGSTKMVSQGVKVRASVGNQRLNCGPTP